MADSKFDYLQQLIQRTRLAHIAAEKRLLRMDLLVKHATVYYACWTVGLSLATSFANSKWLAFLSIVSSIVVALFTVYAGSQNYAVRAEQMKNSYIQLQDLWLDFDSSEAEEGDRAVFVDRAGERYIAIIRQTENHLECDDEQSRSAFDELRIWGLRIAVYGTPLAVAGVVSIAMALGVLSWC